MTNIGNISLFSFFSIFQQKWGQYQGFSFHFCEVGGLMTLHKKFFSWIWLHVKENIKKSLDFCYMLATC